MTLGSLFDGSGGFPLAGAMNGITPVWASEVEPYPIAVTRSRFPQMKHMGSVTEIHGSEIEPVDVITFGSPCQDMSTAGKRAGMKHADMGNDETTRSGLFYEAIRIIREMREATNGKYPDFAVWENVPGAFTSNKGEDFRCVLEMFARIKNGNVSIPRPAGGRWADAGEIVGDGFSIAWRVLDAKYWGVPQRRRRIYAVADFAGGRAGKILFERESMRGDSAAGGAARETIATNAGGGANGGYRSGCLIDRPAIAFMAGQGARARSLGAVMDGSPTLKGCPSGLNQAPSVIYPIDVMTIDCHNDTADTLAPTICANASKNGGHSVIYPAIHPTMTAHNASNVESAMEFNGVVYPDVVCMAHGQSNAEVAVNHSPTLTCDHEQPIVSYEPKPPRRYIVRRLTPTECARLQGFPDCWGVPDHMDAMTVGEADFWEAVRKTHAAINGRTYRPYKSAAALLKWYNGLHTDSAEYKMWGNGIALPCAAFVLEGVAEDLRERQRIVFKSARMVARLIGDEDTAN